MANLNLKRRLLTVLKYSVYPLFYLLCLFVFFYLTFPWDRLKERMIAEFAATQTTKGAEAQRLEIGTLSGYWVTGIEVRNAKLIIPPSSEELAAHDLAQRNAANESLKEIARGEKSINDLPSDDDDAKAKDDDKKADGKADKDGDDKKAAEKVSRAPKETVLLVERATARLQLLPLLIGRIRMSFDVEAFGGEIHGSVPVKGKGDVEVAIDHVDLAQIPLVKKVLTLPLRGILTADLKLSREDGKTAKSDGTLNVTIDDAVLGDGKSKLANMITLPAAKLGKIEIAATADKGLLKVTKLAASGDVELSGEGSVKLKEKWRSSVLDLFLRVKLADEYRNKDDKTKLIFGETGSKIPGLIDSQPKIKRARRDDDSYGLHVYGALKAPKYEPWTGDEPPSDAASKKKEKDPEDKDEPTLTDPFKRKPLAPKPPKSPRAPFGGNNNEDRRTTERRSRNAPSDAPAPSDPLEELEPEGPAPQDDAPAEPGADDQAAPAPDDAPPQ